MQTAEERKARNEAAFRDANELIRESQVELGVDGGRLPFLCECEDERCRTVVQLTAGEYEHVRAEPTHFLVAAGHPASGGHSIEQHDGWCVVEKDGLAGDIARAEDPRRGER